MGVFAVAISAIFLVTVTRYTMLRTPPATPEARLQRIQSASMLGAALSELPAVLGLALFITTRNRGDFYIMLVLSAYMLIRHFPRRAAWETYVRRGTDAR
jgi:L-amino acid N-acyltransferase YncA